MNGYLLAMYCANTDVKYYSYYRALETKKCAGARPLGPLYKS